MKDKILVVIDMQNDFVTGALGTKEAQAIVPKVVAKIEEYKKQGYPVLATMDTHHSNYLQTNEGRHLPIEHCLEDTTGWKLVPEIDPLIRDVDRVRKSQFANYALARIITLHCTSECEIELIGVCTDICVVSNALLLKSYMMPETTITVDASCCAGTTPEAHEAALKVMKNCQIEIIGG